jgi:D-alanyl-D-alanine carboxypeptidase
MKKYKYLKFIIIFLLVLLVLPAKASALLAMSDLLKASGVINGLTAKSYIVIDKQSGEVLESKSADLVWTPASLTKLVTALVVLDYNPNLTKNIAMKKSDEVGGARLATKTGVSYKVKDLFYAALVASANNATNALARSTGLSSEQFLEKMNEKAKNLGAKNTIFYEPTGISEKNVTTAEDFSKITAKAFENPTILAATSLKTYSLTSVNNKRYKHNLKNTNKLLGDLDMVSVNGKTGYLNESQYNFAAEIKDRFGSDFIVVLFGSSNTQTQFAEAKELAFMAGMKKAFSPFKNLVFGNTN